MQTKTIESTDGRLKGTLHQTPAGYWRATLETHSGRRQTRIFKARGTSNERRARDWIHGQIFDYEDFKARRGEYAAD